MRADGNEELSENRLKGRQKGNKRRSGNGLCQKKNYGGRVVVGNYESSIHRFRSGLEAALQLRCSRDSG
jgi:hypothetical protein